MNALHQSACRGEEQAAEAGDGCVQQTLRINEGNRALLDATEYVNNRRLTHPHLYDIYAE